VLTHFDSINSAWDDAIACASTSASATTVALLPQLGSVATARQHSPSRSRQSSPLLGSDEDVHEDVDDKNVESVFAPQNSDREPEIGATPQAAKQKSQQDLDKEFEMIYETMFAPQKEAWDAGIGAIQQEYRRSSYMDAFVIEDVIPDNDATPNVANVSGVSDGMSCGKSRNSSHYVDLLSLDATHAMNESRLKDEEAQVDTTGSIGSIMNSLSIVRRRIRRLRTSVEQPS
jgi:hypothetical protein